MHIPCPSYLPAQVPAFPPDCPSVDRPALQIVEQHKAFLRRLMKGCLLSRKVRGGPAAWVGMP